MRWRVRRGQGGFGSLHNRMTSAPHRLEGVSGFPDTLRDLPLARGTLDRAGLRRRDPDLLPSLLKGPSTRVESGREVTLFLRSPRELDANRLAVFLGQDGDGRAYVGVVGESLDPDGASQWQTLREIGALLPDRDAGLFATMKGLTSWHASHTHCPQCGAPTVPDHSGWIRRCTQDGSEHYPRTDPAVIMAVTDPDDRLLLARSPHWPEGRLSVLAGFVEPGESLEAAVAREVFEEVGVVVEQVRYLGNQPWPFPSSLMVGFSSKALNPTLHLDMDEIVEALWVTREELQALARGGHFGISPTVSIARRIIERWYGAPIQVASAKMS